MTDAELTAAIAREIRLRLTLISESWALDGFSHNKTPVCQTAAFSIAEQVQYLGVINLALLRCFGAVSLALLQFIARAHDLDDALVA